MLFDIHGDIWTDVTVKRAEGKTDIIRNYHLDRFKKGNMVGGIFVIWADPPHDEKPRERLIESIRAMSTELAEAKDIVKVIYSKDDFYEAIATGKLAVILGLEGLAAIGEDISLIDVLYQIGFRHASLTWNEQNALATGVKGEEDRGLTEAGKKAIIRMNELGMVVDVSHANEKTFWDVIELSDKPVIASHSNVRSICDVARNLTDEQIKAIGKSGGLVGMNSYNEFIHADPKEQSVERLIDHIDRIVKLIGADKVALGFDFFEYLQGETTDAFTMGGYKGTIGLEDITKGDNIIKALRERGYSEYDIEGFTYRNFIELFDKITN